MNEIIHGDSYELIKEIPDKSIDLICTDPPYGLKFMGKTWDKALPPVSFWKECLRVLKPGAFAFVMCIPRQDCLARMIVNLEDAGFKTGFTSIYWTYAQGFPKATNISKKVDEQKGLEREIIGKYQHPDGCQRKVLRKKVSGQLQQIPIGANPHYNITASVSPEAKALDGSYAGYQPKPAVEIIIVVMKLLDCKTYVEQALKNGKGVTWLDEGRIPVEWKDDPNFRKDWEQHQHKTKAYGGNSYHESKTEWNTKMFQQGRFPANLLVSDDILNDGKIRTQTGGIKHKDNSSIYGRNSFNSSKTVGDNSNWFQDSGSYSRYFNLDYWFAEQLKQLPKSIRKTFPWLIVPKPCPSEKNQGYEGNGANNHPTVKSLKLFTYLITIGSRPDDVVFDPFVGSGTTALVCNMLNRKFLCIEKEKEYYDLACVRLAYAQQQLTLNL